MGIPSYFSYVLKNHHKIINRLSQVKCNQLYIDANSIIYDVVHENTSNIYEDVYNFEEDNLLCKEDRQKINLLRIVS
jgi:5'-3' exonuclease